MGPWTTDQTNHARRVPCIAVLAAIGVHFKPDHEYEFLGSNRQSVQLQVVYRGRRIQFIITGDGFNHAVKVCLGVISL